MPIADLIRLGLAPGLTAADIASLALSADQERRRAARAGRLGDAVAHDHEADRLAYEYRKRA